MSELSAVNAMLASIGERPVNTLEDPARADVVFAVNALDGARREVLLRGWKWNTELNVELAPTAAGEYILPANVLQVDESSQKTRRSEFVKRGNRLYNRDDRTFSGNTANIFLDWLIELDFDDCTTAAQLYIERRGGILFQQAAVGSELLFRFSSENARVAYALLLKEDLKLTDIDLTQAPSVYSRDRKRWRP